MLGAVLLLCPALLGSETAPSAADIMARVAANQERAERLRSAFVYEQSVQVRMHRGNGKLAREERSEFTVTPTSDGTRKELTRFAGKYESKGRMVAYDKPRHHYKDIDIDGGLASELADACTNEKHSRDGVAADLFPLTGKAQSRYVFRLEGNQQYRGRDVYAIAFQPAPGKNWTEDENDGTPWAGEVLVDAREFEPVLITTHLARGIPFVIRTLLGTNLKSLGFKIAYDRFDGAWFPVSYGGEFELRVVFFYKRRISLSMTNRGFRRADVESRIVFAK